MTLDVTFSSAALEQQLAKLASGVKEKIAGALYRHAEQIMKATDPLVPVDEGILKGSGHVQLPKIEGHDVSVTMGFGGAASAYALIQHENMQFHHRVGQAKFLEQPFLAMAPKAIEEVGKAILEP